MECEMKLINGKIRLIANAFFLLVLLSCTPKIGLSDLEGLRMEMSPDEPPIRLGVHPREVLEWPLEETGDTIIVQGYIFSSGGAPTAIYFLAYKNASLIFWGYPHEFARSSDPLIREIGKEALSRYDKSHYYP
jgi:hypothetical protein